MAKKETRTVEIVMDGKQPARTLSEINKDIRTLTSSLRQMEASSPQWDVQARKLNELRGQYVALDQQLKNTGKSFFSLKDQATAVFAGFTAANAAIAAVQGIKQYVSDSIDSVAQLSDEMADIRKVTGMTAEQVDYLNEQLKEMDTRTSISELRGLAYEAGKLGNEGVENVLGFVNAADKINVALGRDLGADAVTQIGKLVDIFKLKEEFGLEKGMLKIGSAINEVGAASTATESYLVDFTNRMAGVAGIGKISAPEILGLAGTMDSFGQSSEVATTTISKLLTKMGGDVPKFAKMAGKSVEDFRKVMDQSALQALYLVIEQMGKSAGGMEELSGYLGDIGLDGGRVVAVLGTLAKNMQEVTRQTEIATAAFDQGTSVLDEFNIKNETTAAKIEKLKNQLAQLKETQTVRNMVQALIDTLTSLVNLLKNSAKFWQEHRWWILSVVAAYVTYNAVLLINATRQKAVNVLMKAGTAIMAIYSNGLKAVALAQAVMNRNITIMTALQRVWNRVALLNPYVAIAAAVVAAGVAIDGLIKKQRQLRKEMEENEIKLKIKTETENTKELSDNIKKLKNDLQKSTGDVLKRDAEIAKAHVDITQKVYDDQLKNIQTLQSKLDRLRKENYNDLIKKGFSVSEDKTPETKEIRLLREEILKNEELAKQQKTALQEAIQLSGQYIDKVKAEEQAAKDAAAAKKKLTEEELERIKKLNEEYQKLLNDLQKARSQATVQVIEDDFQRELAQLRLNHQERLKEIEKQITDQLTLARKLGKSKTEINNILQIGTDLKAGATAEYNRQVQTAVDNNEKKVNEAGYQKDIEDLAKYLAGEKILLNESYRANKINKQQYEDAITTLEITGKQRLIDITNKYCKNTIDAEKDLSDAQLEITLDKNKQRQAAELAAAERRLAIADMEAREAQRRGIGNKKALEEQYNAEQDLLLRKIANELDLTELTEEQKLEIRKKYAEEFAQLDEQYAQLEMERRKGIAQTSFNTASQFVNELFGLRVSKLQEELTALENKYTAETELLNKQKAAGLLSDADYNKRKEKLDEVYNRKQAQIKRKQAIAEKSAALFNIGIETAKNVTQAFPDFIMMGLAAALGITQAAIVASKKVPEFRTGTRLTDKVLPGPSHDSRHKGIHMIDPVTGQLIALAEGGEVILSKKTVQNNAPLVDALLYSSQKAAGASIMTPEYYRSYTAPDLDYRALTGSVRTNTMYRTGGMIADNTTASTTTLPTAAAGGPDPELIRLLQLNYQVLANMYQNGVEAYFDYEKYKVSLAKLQKAEKAGMITKST